jgi:serine/threonine protein kinase
MFMRDESAQIGSSGIELELIAAARADATRLASAIPDRFDRRLLEFGVHADRIPQLPEYDVLREAHRGAQGVVFEARHRMTGRHVAIKVLRSGPWVGPNDAARFEREIRVLGLLRHPGIVAVLDGGVASGSAYLVMDFIDGPPLDEYVRAELTPDRGGITKRATERRRLNQLLTLFADVCDAVGAAHVRGVIHRDLKPANIRVDSAGRPHVLDFGLAKLLDEDTIDFRAVEATQSGQFLGSLPWTSPEQAEGAVERVDMRSDVYSLGVILYHLLTDAFPYPTDGTLRSTLDTIVRTDPASPRVKCNSPFPIDEELETIVLKCLSKDPNRRYLTASELARDVRSYRDGLPIEAKRDSGWYMMKKSIARHRALAASSVLLLAVILLALGLVYLAWQRATRERAAAMTARALEQQARTIAEEQKTLAESLAQSATEQRERAQHLAGQAQAERDRAVSAEQAAAEQRERAEFEARRAAATAEYLQEVLSSADPNKSALPRPPVTVRELLDKASERMDQNKTNLDPKVEANVREALAKSYESLGAHGPARQQLETTLTRSTETLGADHPATLQTILQLALLSRSQGKLNEAETMLRDLLDRVRRVFPPNDPKIAATLVGLARVLRDRAVVQDAEPIAREALEIRRTALGPDHPETIEAVSLLGWILADQGRNDEADALLRQALETSVRVLGETDPRTVGGYSDLGWFLMRTPNFAEAAQLFEKAASAVRQTAGEESVQYVDALNGVAAALRKSGQLAEAEALYADVLARCEQLFGENHPRVALVLDSLARVRIELGKLEDAEPPARRALEIRRTVLGDSHLHTYFSMTTLAEILRKRGVTDGVEPLLRDACEGLVRLKGVDDPAAKAAIDALVHFYQETGRPEEAENLLRIMTAKSDP